MSQPLLSINQRTSIDELIRFLEAKFKERLDIELNNETPNPVGLILDNEDSSLSQFISEKALTEQEVLILVLTIIPHIFPSFLNNIVSDFLPDGGEFTEFGGIKGKNHRGILPTAETALYLLSGSNIKSRISEIENLFSQNKLLKANIIYIEKVPVGEPTLSGKLILDEEYLVKLTTGLQIKPNLSQNFPASLINTKLNFEDLVLPSKTKGEVEEIQTWIEHNNTLLDIWKMKGKIKPGYRVLFFGPPGTGKTLAASLLGKLTNRDVYRIDLSMVVSKYIGETEKNLSNLFDKAINKDWILFFDEADAIFGKRTNVRDAHDKHANQEVSYLLQRIEDHPGLVILASNFKNNIDAAFTRRFQSIIEFEAPSYNERLKLWQNNLNFPPEATVTLESSISLEELSQKYALTGANIVNIVQYACLRTISNTSDNNLPQTVIQKAFILEGIKKEYLKEGKTITVN